MNIWSLPAWSSPCLPCSVSNLRVTSSEICFHLHFGSSVCIISLLHIFSKHTCVVAVVVDCGTDPLGHVSVKYTNKDPTTNKVLRMSSPKNKATCVASESSGVFTIADVRTNCEITQPVSKEVLETLTRGTTERYPYTWIQMSKPRPKRGFDIMKIMKTCLNMQLATS